VGPLRLIYPINRMVYQRDNSANGGKAKVKIVGEILGQNFTNKSVSYKITKLDSKTGYAFGCPVNAFCPIDVGYECDFTGYCYLSGYTNISKTAIDATTAKFALEQDLAAGWYIVQIMLTKPQTSKNTPVAYTHALFGVGDVYVIAGQSNARGQETKDDSITENYPYSTNDRFPDDKLVPVNKTYNDPNLLPEAVSVINKYSSLDTESEGAKLGGLPFRDTFSKLTNQVFNIYPIGRYSWVYGPLGKKIVESSTGVPVAFFNTGFGWKTVGDFTNSITNGTAPYGGLRNTLQSFASIFGIKGILWHQGEKDNAAATSEVDYTTRLNQIIAQTRTDFNANLPWFISKASLVPVGGIDNVTSSNIVNGQNAVIAGGTNVFNGVFSDDIIYTGNVANYGRGPTYKVHFHDAEHETVGQRWFNANLQQSTPIVGKDVLPLAITKVGANYKLAAPTGFAKYIWSKNDEGIYNSSINASMRFSREITVSTQLNSDVYTCYVSNDTDADNEVNGWNLRLQITEPFVIPNAADAAKILTVSNNTLFYTNTATTAQNLTVSSQAVVWQPANNISWIHLSNVYGGGNGNTLVSITVDDNYTGNPRTETFQIQEEGGGLIQTITVKQGVNPCGDFTTLSNPISNFYSGSDITKANISIISNIEILNLGTSMQYRAGQSIFLQPGTIIGSGAVFKAEIVSSPCSN
jgi:Carbohydrate esterase, sialic acid-specific acetylesterase